jgi:hypothetical protein
MEVFFLRERLRIIEITERGKRSLAETDPSIVRRHEMVGPNIKAVGFEERSHIFEQKFVLEDAP